MKITGLTGSRRPRSFIRRQGIRWIFAALLIALGLFLGNGEGFEATRLFAQGSATDLGGCRISVVQVHVWRDWMPIVANPGPDRGSPLRAKVRVSLDNSAGGEERLSFRGSVMDPTGHSHPVSFQLKNGQGVLPSPVSRPYTKFGDEEKRGTASGDREEAIWLSAGEVRVIELTAANGPYLPAASPVQIEIAFTNQKGDGVTVRSPVVRIQRTD